MGIVIPLLPYKKNEQSKYTASIAEKDYLVRAPRSTQPRLSDNHGPH